MDTVLPVHSPIRFWLQVWFSSATYLLLQYWLLDLAVTGGLAMFIFLALTLAETLTLNLI